MSLLTLIPWWGRALALIALCTALIAFGWVKGSAHESAKFDAYKLSEAQQAAQILRGTIAKQTALQLKKDEALNAAAKRTQVAQENLASARLSVGGLLDDLATVNSKLSSASLDAARKYSATANAVFGECAGAITELAGKADGHSVDSLMYQESWPK